MNPLTTTMMMKDTWEIWRHRRRRRELLKPDNDAELHLEFHILLGGVTYPADYSDLEEGARTKFTRGVKRSNRKEVEISKRVEVMPSFINSSKSSIFTPLTA